MTCSCGNIEIGSYGATVVVPIPSHMTRYQRKRVEAGLSPNLSIDACILPELQVIWSHGVSTFGSCCGHNKRRGYIEVQDDYDACVMRQVLKYQPVEADELHCPELYGLSFYPKLENT